MNKVLIKSLELEFFELKDLSLQPENVWDLIWVLSGDQLDIKRDYKKRNESRERVVTAINVSKEVAGLRAGKELSALSDEDIKEYGPIIYFSGYNSHNLRMKKYQQELYFKNYYAFPDSKLLIGPQEDNLHTDSQFQKFPDELIKSNRKIIIVTDAYHIPRCRRYLKKYSRKFLSSRIIFYPSHPVILDKSQILLEINKIIKYTQNGILPLL